MSQIEAHNLWQIYQGQIVLEALNVGIEAGEFCTLVGASGCGKSTFLRLLLGQERPSKGSLTFEGAPLPGEPDVDRGVVFQRYSVFRHLRVLDNVLLGLELRTRNPIGRLFGSRKRAATEAAEQMLDNVGLLGHRDKYPAQLSGGMQQRLALAQALAVRPRVLLLDEPFGALDPGIRADMHALLLRIWREHGMTVVMVTHDLQEGFTLGSRLLVFDKTRHDPQAPERYGATITYDIPLDKPGMKFCAPTGSPASDAPAPQQAPASTTHTAIR